MATNSILTTCELCSQHFSDPRMLPCLHSFCFECLQKFYDATKSGHSCPTCKETFEVPEGKIETLQKDLYGSYVAEVAECEEKVQNQSEINCDRCIVSSESVAVKFCCNCCKFLCSWCAKDHTRRSKTHKHELVDMGEKKGDEQEKSLLNSIPRKVINCQVHCDEVLKFYCTTCSCLICRDCIILSHSGHSYDRVEAASEKEKGDLLALAEEADCVVKKLQDAVGKGEKSIQNIKTRQQSVDDEIKESFKILQEELHRREESLLAKSSEVGLTKITALTLQLEGIKGIYDEITRVNGCVKEAVGSYTPAEILSAKKPMTAKLQSLIEQFSACSLVPCKSGTIYTNVGSISVFKGEIEKFGVVTEGCCVTASTASLYIPQAIKAQVKTVLITTRDGQGKPFLRGGDIVKAKLGLVGNGGFDVDGAVQDNGDGTYEVSVTPQATGDHQLSVMVGNEHIQLSPFVISVTEKRQYNSLVLQQQYTVPSTPWGITFSSDGNMYIANYGSHCIQVMDEHGSILRTIGTSGTGNLQFTSPTAVAIRGDVVYVAEINRIQKFTTSGEFLSTFGSGQLSGLYGICFDPQGKIYVSEMGNNRISVFEANGSFERHISGNLNGPRGLAFDPSGNLHVANQNSSCISIFTSDGKYIKQYNTTPQPIGIAIDPEGYVFVCEYTNKRLCIFNPQLQVQNTIALSYNPIGVALDRTGCIYVSSGNNISKF